ncbi:uncharacterized protein LOC129239005 [Anastrepha obliqua]|uniref:uncharacterized protein LOC129239005 n=1 Tax=Anastrepha obliqua TaxID=95512 RepID=UPI00240A49D9|nr:uncharacterized protein LOC129239005 [Anastrepha obliqua]
MAWFGCPPLVVRLSSMIIYFLCGVMEIISFSCTCTYISSICVTARENSGNILLSLHCIFPQIISDLMLAVGGFFWATHFYAPLGFAYNIIMAVLCAVSATYAILSLTGCGNPAQPIVFVSSIFALIAGGLHLTLPILVALNLEDDDFFLSFGRFDD